MRVVDVSQRFFKTVLLALLFVALPNATFAQKGKPKPPPPPPTPAIVTTQEIVYSTYNNQGVHSLVVANKDGTNQTVVASGQWYNVPSWHPNGDEIIFSSAIPEAGIWSIKLNRGLSVGVFAATRLVPQTMWGGQTTPVWSLAPIDFQDGTAPRHVIAYADRPAGKTNLNIFLWDPGNTATPARAINLTEENNHSESYPTWSPLVDENGRMQLAVVHTTATGNYPYDLKLLTIGVGVDCLPTQIICVTARESLVRRISPDPGASTPDCYAPAGSIEPSPLCGPTTALLRPRFGNTGEAIALGDDGDLWIVPLDAPAGAYDLIANIVNFPSGSSPSWSPDDSQIIYRGSVGSQRTVCGKKNWNGIVRINTNGAPFPNGCFVEFVITGPTQDPNWWRGANANTGS